MGTEGAGRLPEWDQESGRGEGERGEADGIRDSQPGRAGTSRSRTRAERDRAIHSEQETQHGQRAFQEIFQTGRPRPSTDPGRMSSQADVGAPTKASLLHFTEDTALSEMMRLRVDSLKRTMQKRQDGERLLLPHEAVYRLDFSVQELTFVGWHVTLKGHGRVTVTGISQLWTPDLTHLMTRQLLEPVGTFWRNAGDPEDTPLKYLEADLQEFGERIAELAKVRKVMYFLFAFKEGAERDSFSCSAEFARD